MSFLYIKSRLHVSSTEMILCILFTLVAVPAESANILFATSFLSVSHQSVFQPIWKELSLRGHNVTAIALNPLHDKTLTNLTEIDLNYMYAQKKEVSKKWLRYFLEKPGFLQVFLKDILITYLFSIMHDNYFQQPVVQNIINGDQEFDVVIAEWLFPTLGAFSTRFKCPLIGITSLGAPIPALDSVGNPSHPVYSPDHNLPIGRELSLRDRILSTLYAIYVRVHYHLFVLPREDKTVKKYFGRDMPYIGDIERNISLLLLNRNLIIHKIMPVYPAVIELGNVRPIKVHKPLSSELKDFLDNSKNGVVYFSFGSNLLSSELPEEYIQAIIETFAKLPYNFVWKWEKDVLPGKPKNVFIQKWVSQTALLAHPNVKLFITQGGLQSLEETITNHVPIIGIPSHSDQTMNVDTAVKYGFGICIDFEDLTVETLEDAILRIMRNESYKQNVIKAEKLMNDLPTNGLNKAVWWIEYVIRHKGAPHLRSPALDIPWYQYLLLDVFALVVPILVVLIYIYYKIMKWLILLLKNCFSKNVKTKKE
ncbi:hypothetical protein HHI36_019174 [Cryptolaemus montrouzieri]|uniref:UDP-glucuronosyltransferase n=1 Tax=Cryptolaemus montrouzieri TaxID=559131 RepID=A0ABD2P2N9_9CUCU